MHSVFESGKVSPKLVPWQSPGTSHCCELALARRYERRQKGNATNGGYILALELQLMRLQLLILHSVLDVLLCCTHAMLHFYRTGKKKSHSQGRLQDFCSGGLEGLFSFGGAWDFLDSPIITKY